MKTLLIIFLLIAGLAIVASAAFPPVEEQKYSVLSSDKQFEIRHYPPALLASVQSPALTYRESANSSFRKLAGYIFGGNQSSQKIAMTAPVHMTFNDSGTKMSFVMPAKYSEEDLPQPIDSGIAITKSAERKVAVIKFGGFAGDRKIREKTEELIAWMSKQGLTIKGRPEYLGYNPPYRLFGRRNEIIAEIL
jgi:hypothetical protein